MGSGKNWSNEEVEFLKSNWQNMTDEQIAVALNRPTAGVEDKRKRLGLFKDRAHRKYDFGDVVYEFSKTKYELVSEPDDYINAAENTLKYICPDHRDKGILTISLGHLQSGRGCPYCGREKTTKAHQTDLTNIKYKKTCEDRNLEYVHTIRKNGKIFVGYICPNHREIGIQYMYYWNLLRISEGCAYCHKSVWENVIHKILLDFNIQFETEKEFEGLKDVRPLRFDFYLPTLNKLIEYDGKHHFEPLNFNGISKAQAIREFENVKRRDKLKDDYCIKHNIPLLRIPYYEFENSEQLIRDFVF